MKRTERVAATDGRFGFDGSAARAVRRDVKVRGEGGLGLLDAREDGLENVERRHVACPDPSGDLGGGLEAEVAVHGIFLRAAFRGPCGADGYPAAMIHIRVPRANPLASLAWALSCLLLLASCSRDAPPGATGLPGDLYVEPLEPGLWRHVSHRVLETAGRVPSNGLVVATPDGALLVDTAWTPEQTDALLDWTEAHVGPVQAVLVTHAHDDRIGGIETVHGRGIPSYGLEATSKLSEAQGGPPLTHPFATELSLAEFGIPGEVFYPGPGHTVDNAVVWLEDSGTLFGSCMVRAATWGIGNLEDAVPEAWPESAALLVERYGNARRVVPGHGDPGGPELLVRTQALVDELASTPDR